MKSPMYVVLILVLLVFTATQQVATADDKSEYGGTWELIYFERDGKAVKLQNKTQAIITGTKFVVKRGDEVIAAGTSKLDTSTNPKRTISTYTEGRDKGKTFKGIYRLEGNILTFCRPGSPDDEFPTEFKTTPDSGAFVSIYKRAAP
jgi:uncharacterized protein (TIGR03067 family)